MVMLGTYLPEHLIGTDQGALTEFLKGAEDLGYGYVTVGDHVLGADSASRPNWKPYAGKAPLYDHRMPWHEPLVLFGYLAALSRTLELCTGILISPQRQAALLAKQAAEADILTGGRIRFVLAAGWNDVEYEALGVDFAQRGKIMEEQVILMRQLWTQELVTYHGKFHTVNAAGINPLPVQRPIPLWFGGQSKAVLNRIGRLADGWFPHYPYFSEKLLHDDLATIHRSAKEAGRDPASIGISGGIYFVDSRYDPKTEMPPDGRMPPQSLDECVKYAHWWKKFGCTRYTVTAPWANLGPEETGIREPGKKWTGIESRLRALAEFKDAVGKDF
jgi:probable F420-dependent oxidoreductase